MIVRNICQLDFQKFLKFFKKIVRCFSFNILLVATSKESTADLVVSNGVQVVLGSAVKELPFPIYVTITFPASVMKIEKETTYTNCNWIEFKGATLLTIARGFNVHSKKYTVYVLDSALNAYKG